MSALKQGDIGTCPLPGHLAPPIATGLTSVLIEGKPAARQGDTLGCGATLTSGSSSVLIGGQAAGKVGSTTSHGGSVLQGSARVLIGG